MSEYGMNDDRRSEYEAENLSNDIFESTQPAEIGNLNSKFLQNLLEKKRNEFKKIKTSEEWLNHSSQIELRNHEFLREEQSQIISELQTKADQFLQRAENETHMRVKVNLEMEKIKKNIQTFKNYYEVLKKSMVSCIEAKNKIEKMYQQSAIEIDQHIKDKNVKIKAYMAKTLKLKKCLCIENEKYTRLENEFSNLLKQKDEEIYRLNTNEAKLIEGNQALEENKTKLLRQISESLNENRNLLEQLTICKQNYEQIIEDLKQEIEMVKNLLDDAKNEQLVDKKTIAELMEDLESHKKSLKEQNDFMNEVLGKNEQIENALTDLEKENEILRNGVNDYKIEMEVMKVNMQSDITTAQNLLMESEDSLNILKEDYNQLKQEYETAKDIIMTLTKKMEEKQEKENKLEESLSELQQNLIDFQIKTTDYQNLIVTLTEETNEKSNKINKLNNEYLELEIKYKNSTTKLQDRYDNIFIENENLKQQNDLLQQQNDELLQENEMIKCDSSNKIDELKEQSDRKIKEIVEHNETYKNEHEKIRQNEKLKFTNEISQLTDTIKTMELQMNELKASKQYLENELNHKIRETAQLTEEKERLISKSDKSQMSAQTSDAVTDLDKNIQIEKPKPKRNYMNKIRERLPWNDSWSDSSIENEYVSKAWKPKLPDTSQRLIPLKRKILSTPVNDDTNKEHEDLFDSLRTSSPLKPPTENKVPKKRTRKPFY